jgi:hypothetical protein
MLLKHKVNPLFKHPGANGLFDAIFGGGDTETTQKTEPWAPAQPYLTAGMADASNIYNTLGATAPYTGNQIALMPDQMMQNTLGAIDYTQNSIPWYQQAMLDAMMPALTGYSPSATGGGGSVASRGVDLTSGVPQMSASLMGNPAEVAAGGYDYRGTLDALLGGDMNNPWLAGMAQDLQSRVGQQFGDVSRGMNEQLTTDILPGLENMFGGAGALGSSRQALLQGQAIGRTNDALAREYGDMNTNLQGTLANLYGNAFENSQGRRASLASQLAGENLQERMANAGYAQQTGLANMGAQNTAAQSNLEAKMAQLNMLAQQSMANASMANNADQNQLDWAKLQMDAAGNLGSAMYLPLQAQGVMGSAYAPYLSQEQSLYDLAGKQYYDTAQAPWNALEQYMKIINPAAGLGSTGMTTEDGGGLSLSGGIGGYLAGNAMADSLMGSTVSSALGAGTLNAMPWLGAVLGMSDRRLKTAIKPLGVSPGGHNLYSFRYVWGGPEQVGVMADEVKAKLPGAVVDIGGFDAVDYSQIH